MQAMLALSFGAATGVIVTPWQLCRVPSCPMPVRAALLRMTEVAEAVPPVVEAPPPEELPAQSALKQQHAGLSEPRGEADREIAFAKDSDTVLRLWSLDKHVEEVHQTSNVAAALHRLAVINKRRRAGRDALLRDKRFQALIDAVVKHSPEFDSRSVADVLWSFATLQHWPATLLTPVLTGVHRHLVGKSFEPQHLSTITWALAKLECKPVRLLEQIEEQSIPQLGEMDMQNCANLLWGLAKLNYSPAKVLPGLSDALLAPGMLETAKPVEVADLAFAMQLTVAMGEYDELLLALAARAGPDASLRAFTSRQLVILVTALQRLEVAAKLPDGMLDAMVEAIRDAHCATPMLSSDARKLEESLGALDIDATWIKQTEMLKFWAEAASGGRSRRGGTEYTEEELRAVFDVIDVDKSGDIDLSELQTAFKAINPETSGKAIEQMLVFADADGDLSVDFEEFASIMNSSSKRRVMLT